MKNDRPIRVLWWKYELLINERNEYKIQNSQWSKEELYKWNKQTAWFVKERSKKIKELRKLL